MLPSLGPMEMMVVMIVAVLLFGKRLPEVGRSLGKGIIEFKKGIRGIEDEFDASTTTSTVRKADPAPAVDSGAAAVPKFEPPTAAPTPVPATGYEPQPYQD
jgi:sec-independent protein translocase protein TatA